MHETYFSGDDLELDVHDGGHKVSIVTFEARNKYLLPKVNYPFDKGFGAGLFEPMGMNEFIIKRNKNNWYQTPEMLRIIRIINEMTRNHRVITYGGSMGGFAAINFAPMLNADVFIALSPLFDVAPDGELQDKRWEIDWAGTSFDYNFISAGACRSAKGYVFYAKNSKDGPHAELLEKETMASVISVDHGGHPCSSFLNDTYKLKNIVSEVAFETFDIEKFHRVMDERTPLTHYPYEQLSAQFERDGKDIAALEQIRIAIEKKPGLARLHFRLGNLLLKQAEFKSAEAAFDEAIRLDPESPSAYVRISYAHAGMQDYVRAIQAMDKAIALRHDSPEYHARRGEWLLLNHQLADAAHAMMKVMEILPTAVVAPRRLKFIQNRMKELDSTLLVQA